MENYPTLRIALVDDDSDNHLLFQEALYFSGINAELMLFGSGTQLLEHLSDQNNRIPDLVFLDINMPLLSGIECLVYLRATFSLQEIPVVMLTASSSQKDIEESFRVGANRYFIKPVSFNEMARIVKKVISDFLNKVLLPERETFVLAFLNAPPTDERIRVNSSGQ